MMGGHESAKLTQEIDHEVEEHETLLVKSKQKHQRWRIK